MERNDDAVAAAGEARAVTLEELEARQYEEGQEDLEFVLLHAVLRLFRDVRRAAPPAMTIRGPRTQVFTATCPVNPAHRLRIVQMRGAISYRCEHCAPSARQVKRLGAWLERQTGLPRVG